MGARSMSCQVEQSGFLGRCESQAQLREEAPKPAKPTADHTSLTQNDVTRVEH